VSCVDLFKIFGEISYPGAKRYFMRDIQIKGDAVFLIADKDLKAATSNPRRTGNAAS
jgi:hypothetical protein